MHIFGHSPPAQALLAYDTLLTFPSEVRFIWHKKLQLGTILYLLAHYPALLQLILNVYLHFATFQSMQIYRLAILCYFLQMLWDFCLKLEFKSLSSHLGLLFARTYAIASHKKLVFVVLALLDITAIVMPIVSIAMLGKFMTFSNHVILGCNTKQ
ncbi:hypothetical protein K439DRAFT_1622555 [Ramaria rubella]|nr:hypothetical protein K439DRAFT_1622555 [Ramaria rubella]